ncbi:MAG TPA: hypothetical protein VE935_05805 [Burkholderiales bacterium]|nr:hypothetical protein [Burkholderiales bacterium]
MQVAVRDIAARCRRCGSTDFAPAAGSDLRLTSVLACSGCGERATYRELLEQIGEEAIRRANESIERLKRRPKKK